jgi:hypothetical protein
VDHAPSEDSSVQTDMANTGAQTLGLEKAEIEVDISILGMIQLIDTAKKEDMSSKLMYHDGTSKPWGRGRTFGY